MTLPKKSVCEGLTVQNSFSPWTLQVHEQEKWKKNSVMVSGNYAIMLGNYAVMLGNYAVMFGSYDVNN